MYSILNILMGFLLFTKIQAPHYLVYFILKTQVGLAIIQVLKCTYGQWLPYWIVTF